MHSIARRLCAIVFMVVSAGTAVAQTAQSSPMSPPRVSVIYGAVEGVAVKGYDVVAYFTEGQPAKGSAAFKAEHAGTTWYFKSQQNLELFLRNPAQYVPQYGGHCAFAAAQDVVASGDPEQWRVVDNKLYLNNNAFAHKRWQDDIAGNVRAGDKNWPGLIPRIEQKYLDLSKK